MLAAMYAIMAGGADVQVRLDNGDTLLYTALMQFDSDTMRLLVDAGADIRDVDDAGAPECWLDLIDGCTD